jgi:hypothetical protein
VRAWLLQPLQEELRPRLLRFARMLLMRRCREPAVTRLNFFARTCQHIRQKQSLLAASRQSCKRSVDTLLTQNCKELDAPRWLSLSRTVGAACSEHTQLGRSTPFSLRHWAQLR